MFDIFFIEQIYTLKHYVMMYKEDKVKQYLVYQITNKLNNKIYIGVHVTENINDNYMGSGTNINKAIQEFGKENFDKLILYNFDNKEDMLEKEAQLVNREFIKRQDTYNIIVGGNQFLTIDTITVKDNAGNYLRVHNQDPRYLSGKLMPSMKNMITVKDKEGKIYSLDKEDPRYLSGELVGITTGNVIVKDQDNNYLMVNKEDPRYLSDELRHISHDMILVKDQDNNYLMVNNEDPRYLSGELIFHWTGKKHTTETKKKIGQTNSIKQTGINNSQFGTCWIYNLKLAKNKKIKKEELNNWIKNGWIKGRMQF